MQIDFSFIAKNKVTLSTQISDFRSAIKVVRKKATKTHKRTSAIRISCENPELTKCSREYHRQSEAVSAYLVGLVYRFLMALDGVHPTNFSECCYFADYSAYGSIFLFTDPVPDLSWDQCDRVFYFLHYLLTSSRTIWIYCRLNFDGNLDKTCPVEER